MNSFGTIDTFITAIDRTWLTKEEFHTSQMTNQTTCLGKELQLLWCLPC